MSNGGSLLGQLRNNFFGILCHKKSIHVDLASTPLKRCLNLLDLTFLSIGSIIGAGIFVFAGGNIRNKAGPGIVLSFVVAGIPTVIAAFCYAEFGARVPKAGSTYDYVYVALGEFWAALVGWFLVSGPVFTGAVISRTWAEYFDSMVGGWIANQTMETVGTFNSPYLAQYPDFFAASLVVAVSAIVAAGAKCSALFNNIFAAIKLVVIAFIVCYGLSFANVQYWTEAEYGGFLPFGFSGVMAAAPACFFAYSGFESACTAGEEAKNPTRHIVLAIGIAIVVSAAAYMLMCTTLTLMVPYNEVSPVSSFAAAFDYCGAYWAKYVVAIGALSALTNILFGSIFPFPRNIYAVASDGLIFQWLAVVNKHTQVPVRAIAIYCAITLLIMLLFDIDALVEFLSMGALLCCTLVSAGVILLRYRPLSTDPGCRTGRLKEKFVATSIGTAFEQFPASAIVVSSVNISVLTMVACSAIIAYAPWSQTSRLLLYVLMLAVLVVIMVGLQLLIWTFVQNEDEHLWFRVPLVPFLPSMCMFFNILMILYLAPLTWLRFSLYCLIGVLIYALYGVRHSVHRNTQNSVSQPTPPCDIPSDVEMKTHNETSVVEEKIL